MKLPATWWSSPPVPLRALFGHSIAQVLCLRLTDFFALGFLFVLETFVLIKRKGTRWLHHEGMYTKRAVGIVETRLFQFSISVF